MPKTIKKDISFTPQEDSLVFTQTELDNYNRKKEWEKENNFYDETMRNFTNRHGGFTFLTTKENILQPMNPVTVGRLVYLNTYLGQDTQLLL